MAETSAPPPRVLRTVLALSLGPSCALAAALLVWRPSPTATALLVVASLGTLLTWFAVPKLAGRRAANWLLLVAALNAALVLPELTLRLVNYRYEAGVEWVFPRRIDLSRRFVSDPDLFWAYPRGRPDVNAMGFRDDPVAVPKPAGVFRIAFLGDSCTDIGDPNYPTAIEKVLNAGRASAPRVESVVLAVSGYSSYQGRVIAEKYGRELQVDVVVVYLGWNDQFRALGQPDVAKHHPAKPGRFGSMVEFAYGKSRTLQFARDVAERIARTGVYTAVGVTRVALDDYRANLVAISRVFSAQRVATVFVTAPTSWYRLGVPEHVMTVGLVPDAATGIRRHQAYNEVVRDVALAEGALLLDLEREFDPLPNLGELMYLDGIHFSESGLQFLARRIVSFLRERGITPAGV